jgi:hypothetical protein
MKAELEFERQRRFLTKACDAKINAALNEMKRQQESRKHVRVKAVYRYSCRSKRQSSHFHNVPTLSYSSIDNSSDEILSLSRML